MLHGVGMRSAAARLSTTSVFLFDTGVGERYAKAGRDAERPRSHGVYQQVFRCWEVLDRCWTGAGQEVNVMHLWHVQLGLQLSVRNRDRELTTVIHCNITVIYCGRPCQPIQ